MLLLLGGGVVTAYAANPGAGGPGRAGGDAARRADFERGAWPGD